MKGERCLSSKCIMVKRPYAPGPKKKRRPSPLSEYGKELMEKQRLKNWYNLRETQFKKYVRAALEKRGVANPADLLIKKLEMRLDNAVFRLGFAQSRKQAKQMVGHKYFLVNGKHTDIPSFAVKKGDVISLSSTKAEKAIIKKAEEAIKKHKAPEWLKLDAEKMEGSVIAEPTIEEVAPPSEVPVIFEFYSR